MMMQTFKKGMSAMKTQELQNANHDHLSFQMMEVAHKPVYDFTNIHRHEYFEINLFEKGREGISVDQFCGLFGNRRVFVYCNAQSGSFVVTVQRREWIDHSI